MTLFDIIEGISPTLKTFSNINAMWLEGSWATGKNHEGSDIDVWLDVKEGTFTKSIDQFRELLSEIGEIDWEESRGVYSTEPMLQKHTFHLAGFPEAQRIELDLQHNVRKFRFNKKEHVIHVIFDKADVIEWGYS